MRDDLSPFGFGTKLRKLEGIISYLKENKIQTVKLFGSVHGNFLSCFSFALRSLGFQIHTTAYTRDRKLKTANRILTERSSHKIRIFSNRKEALFDWETSSQTKEGEFFLPEFGFHFSAVSGLDRLWQYLWEKEKAPFVLWLDVGSGLSFLSAANYFSDKPVKLMGVMIGETEKTWMASLEEKWKLLRMEAPPIKFQLFSPPKGKSFATTSSFWNKKIQSIFEEQKLLLEPVYSAKTWKTMEDFWENRKIKNSDPQLFEQKWIYLHQGGLLSHLDLIL
ncbi:hypothetical protein [Leptospira idonii]|uniref:1-aminocyclopropane-1-carboxylate deaminase n=1 Tax=Leptospira idonii TaxID=1193500 RepID=A0A4V3JXV0_9LEPT|nr:hypothetical protein [Leptospira idonii]TGN18566.1 hypothetical protein EHS15_14365 [Leptospira idonii]